MTAPFRIEFIDGSAQKEYLRLRGSQRELVDKGLARLRVPAAPPSA